MVAVAPETLTNSSGSDRPDVWELGRGVRGHDHFQRHRQGGRRLPDETPPGTGYLTVAVITICAVLTVIMALRALQRPTMRPIMTAIQGRWDHRLSDRSIRY